MNPDKQPSPARMPVGADSFDAFYYRHCCGQPYERNEEWLQTFGRIADRIVSDIGPKRALDAGCAIGLLVESLRARGVEAFGLDLSTFAIASLHDSVKPFCRRGSAAEDLGERFDLIISVELVEHMSPADGEAAIANFCRHTDDVLFSSSPVDYHEGTHVSVHPPEHWAEHFARLGFFRDVDFDGSFITPWAVRFRKGRDPVHRIVRDYERRYAELALERNELRDSAVQLQRAQSDLEAARTELAQARDRIFHMERSFFWKLRRLWLALRRRSE